MKTQSAITLLGDSQQSFAGEIVKIEIEISGRTVDCSIDVTSKEATLADIVPAARKISSKIAISVLQGLREQGKDVPCQKGCCHCCSSLIPMSVPEVFRMREEFLEMPCDVSNALLRKCLSSAVEILHKTGRSDYLKDFAKIGKRSTRRVNKWYGELKQVCPLLSKGTCLLYSQRPLACREHIVTGSSDSCMPDHFCRPNAVNLQVSVLETLGELAGEFEGTEVEAIMLPFAQAWAQDNLWRAERKWPAVEMVKIFAEILRNKAFRHRASAKIDNTIQIKS